MNSAQSQQASVYEGSFLEYDWSDGDLVFANSTCFTESMMKNISLQAEALKPGAIFVTFTKGLDSNVFETLERKRYKMSWGPATVVIQRRLNYDGEPVGPANFNILPSDSVDYEEDNDRRYTVTNNIHSYKEEEEEEEEEEEDDDDEDGDDDDDETVETDDSGLMITGKAMKINRASSEMDNPFRYEDLHETMSPDKATLSPPRTKGSPSRLDLESSPLLQHDDILNSPQDSALLQRKRAAMSNSRTFFGRN